MKTNSSNQAGERTQFKWSEVNGLTVTYFSDVNGVRTPHSAHTFDSQNEVLLAQKSWEENEEACIAMGGHFCSEEEHSYGN